MTLAIDAAVRRGTLDLDVAFAVGDETVAVVGPNGAGKTTLLRAVAGLAPLARGTVTLAGRVLADAGRGLHLAAEQRRIGVVFQDDLLFPHLTARDNVAFGLRARGVRAREARARAEAWLDRLGIGACARARPAELSGGQAQRVGLARALATDPAALLLDEPLSALDVEARQDIRRVLREHLDAFPGPAVLVTHDPVEAATLARRLVVLEDGRVTQAGTIEEITRRPRSTWAAQLAGVNLYRGRDRGDGHVRLRRGGVLTVAHATPGEVFVAVPPSAVALFRARPDGTPRNVWRARIDGLDGIGGRVRVHLDAEVPIVAEITPAAAAGLDLGLGGEVWVAVKASELVSYGA